MTRNTQKQCIQETLLEIRITYSERGLSKILKNLNLVLFLNPVSFNGNYYGKQKEPNTFGNFMIIFVILIQRTF